MNKIQLNFPKNIEYIVGMPYGNKVYHSQVKKQLDWDTVNEIWFPDSIQGVSISFVQGFLHDLFHEYGKPPTLNKIKLKTHKTCLQNRLDRAMTF